MIQIALVGLTPEVVEEGLRKEVPDKLYILHTQNESNYKFENEAKKLKKKIVNELSINVVLQLVNAFDMEGIIRTILNIINKEKTANKLDKKDFVVNLTGGTKLMVAAAATAAYLAQSRIFYVHDPKKVRGKELVQELPIPIRNEIPDNKGNSTKTTSVVLAKIRKLTPTNNIILLENLKYEKIVMKSKNETGKAITKTAKFIPQILNYHLKKLLENNLVNIERGFQTNKGINRKLNTITITKTGEYYADFPDLLGEVI